MKPGGVILTYILWKDWKQWWFNIPLLIGQLIFMVVGTAYGKVNVPGQLKVKKFPQVVGIMGVIASLVLFVKIIVSGYWYISPCGIAIAFFFLWAITEPPLRRVWRAAQCSHVRLCLKKMDYWEPLSENRWTYINFGYPEAKMDYWRMDQIDGKCFRYFEPTFNSSPEFIAAMIEYAEAQVGKPYDTLQLFSYGLNFIVWLWPPWWGKEKLKWLNLRGGREVCSSGVAADLRWGERDDCPICRDKPQRVCTIFFRKYDTAMVSPCLIAIDENWRKNES